LGHTDLILRKRWTAFHSCDQGSLQLPEAIPWSRYLICPCRCDN